MFQWAPELQVGFEYVPTLMRAGVLGDARSAKICQAFTICYEALEFERIAARSSPLVVRYEF